VNACGAGCGFCGRCTAKGKAIRYCEPCGEWMSQRECPDCGAPTVKGAPVPTCRNCGDTPAHLKTVAGVGQFCDDACATDFQERKARKAS
jgi:hypothetical protein